MGLLDVFNELQGRSSAQMPATGNSGGMSPLMIAMMGLLAYRTLKGSGAQAGTNPAATGAGGLGGLLGGLLGNQGAAGGGLGGLLGGALAGGAGGSVLSGGLNDLLRQFQQSGQQDTVQSWVGNGPNRAISPTDLANALGADQIETLMTHSGLSRNELLAGLSQHLPDVVNQLTPNGRVPTEQELSQV